MKADPMESKRETALVPVVTLEEVVLHQEEREELLASLAEAEADIAAGRTTPFDRESFLKEFLAICRGEID